MLYRVIYYFTRPYKLLYGLILVVTLATAALESLGLSAFFPVFSSMVSDSGEEVGGILGVMTGLVEFMPFTDPIVAAAVLLIGIFFVKTAFTLLREALTAYGSAKVLYHTRIRVMGRYATSHYQFFLDSKQGDLIYSTMQAPHRMVHNFLLVTPRMLSELLRIAAILIVLMLVSPHITLAIAGLGLIYFGVVHYLSKRVSYNIGHRSVSAEAAQTVITNEFLAGIRQIIAFNTLGGWLRRFARENLIYSELYAKGQLLLAAPRPLMEFTAVAAMLGIILVLRVVGPGTFSETLPKLGVFAMGLVQLLPSVTNFGRFRMDMMQSLPDAERLYHTLEGPVQERTDGSRALESFEKGITFDNVTFAHQGRETLLDGVNLTFEKGKVTAIVGPSGSGKTTIVNLVLGLFEPIGGRVAIDGVSLRNYKLETWLARVGLVGQEPFIYHNTIAENIVFSRYGYSMESVVKAAKIANAHGFISELPEAYDTIIGDRGMKLSGGQQQRIAIARAILGAPEVMIFDEATSSLDSVSERLVQEAIDEASRERTVIVVAHRLSTVRYADNIIVMDRGRVIEEGSHEELLKRQGHYSGLVASSR